MIVLLSWTLRMSVVLLLAFAVMFLLRQRSAALRHWVLTLGLLCAGLTPALTVFVPALTVSESVYLPVLMRFDPFAVYWGYRHEAALLEERRRLLALSRERR